MYAHVQPVATLVTPDGTSEVSRVYFADGKFDLGHGPNKALRGTRGPEIAHGGLGSEGIKLVLTSDHVLLIPLTHLTGITYRL
jgi:hypothetical protein